MRTNSPPTLLAFQERFRDEKTCEEFLFQWRWPDGFRCPRCGGRKATRLAGRRQWQCRACYHQVSITAGTVMHRTKLSLRMWFWAMFLVGRHKKSISAVQLQADLGFRSYRTAWLLLHKIRSCFGERRAFPLKGVVEVDESLVGSLPAGAIRGRGAPQALVVAAVERRADGTLGSARAEVIERADAATLVPFVKRSVASGSAVMTDGWRGYLALAHEDFDHTREVALYGLERPRRVLDGVHLFFSNLKTWLRGRFHGVSPRYMPAYLAEFTYRFNRRHSPPDIFAWVARRLMGGGPRSLAQITATEASA